MAELILVGAPRSGASLLAQLIRQSEDWGATRLTTHQLEAGLANLSAVERGFESHRLTVVDGTPAVLDAVREAGRGRQPHGVTHTVDWNPRLSLRIGLLAAALPEARFVLMVRRPVLTISSLMDAWRTQRFASLPDLPDWWGEPWAFPLVEGWRELIGAPPGQVCATQWSSITSEVLDALEGLSADRWTIASYEGLVDNPRAEIDRIMADLDIRWTGEIPDPLPLTATTVSPPEPGKWQRNWPELSSALSPLEPVIERFRQAAQSKRADLEWAALEVPVSPEPNVRTIDSEGTPFSSSHTKSFALLLDQARASLVITTYKSGHVILAREDEGKVNTEFTSVNRPMGIAVAGTRLAIGSADAILTFTSHAGIAPRVASPRVVDQAYAPRSIVFTGDVAIHDMAYANDGSLYFINTRFSCLCKQDIDFSFIPVWRPKWITAYAAEDRCHVNGLAMVDGQPRFVTALSQTDSAHGWRELKGTSGVIIDITTDQVIADGLSMPHSPRWHDERLWVLESGNGALSTVDLGTGERRLIARLPGFTRGLSFIGPYALVGLSQVRESVFSSLPITSQTAERNCGVWLVDTRDGAIAGFLRFSGMVQEIFEVAVLPATWPVIVDTGELTVNAFVLPDEVLTNVATGPNPT